MKIEILKILYLVGLLIVVSVGLVVAEQKADFNGDGQVNFTDFFLFSEQFGLTQGEPGFDARFDLDKSGEVDFSDFTALKRSFNTQVAAAKVATAGTTNAPTASPGVLVTNTGNARSGYETFGGADAAQGFTTGGNATGYTLTSVEFIFRGIPAGTRSDGLEVFIADKSPLASKPGRSLAILTNPATLSNGVNTFTHPGLHLEPNTTYYAVIDVVCSTYGWRNGVRLTLSHAESGAAGWSIADGRNIQRYAVNHRRHGGSWLAFPSSNVLFSVNGVANAQLAPRQHSLIDDVLRVLWVPSTEEGVTGYLVQWKTGAQSYSTLERSHTAKPQDSSHEVSGLALGGYTVRVTQQGGASDGNAQEATVTLHGWPGVVYLDPVAGDARAADVEWETVSTAAGYVIEVKPVTFDACGATDRATVTADTELPDLHRRVHGRGGEIPGLPGDRPGAQYRIPRQGHRIYCRRFRVQPRRPLPLQLRLDARGAHRAVRLRGGRRDDQAERVVGRAGPPRGHIHGQGLPGAVEDRQRDLQHDDAEPHHGSQYHFVPDHRADGGHRVHRQGHRAEQLGRGQPPPGRRRRRGHRHDQ